MSNSISYRCYSWKSPDKLASDLKTKELIDRYKFGSDEIENQVAHYSLLELIVDRFEFYFKMAELVCDLHIYIYIYISKLINT